MEEYNSPENVNRAYHKRLAEEVFSNSIAVAAIIPLMESPTPRRVRYLSSEVLRLLNPIRDKYGYVHVEHKEVREAVHFLEERELIAGVGEGLPIKYFLTSLGKEVASKLFPGYLVTETSEGLKA